MNILSLLSPADEPSSDWPEVRAQASVIAARRIEVYERQREERIAGYALKWPSSSWTAVRGSGELLRFSREFRP